MFGLGQPSEWATFDCEGTSRRWRTDSPEGPIQVDGMPYPMRPWPERVNEWATLIAAKAAKYGVPASWVAAIMALETGGRPGLCRRVGGVCSPREGMGLMAMLLSTAAVYAGRPVTVDELLNDHDLQVDLGAKMIADLQKRFAGDYVKVAIAYNAGSIRCGNGRTWEKPREPCPPTPWGVVMGCLRTSKRINEYCAPSRVTPGKFACPVDYPQVAIAYHNAAIAAGWTPDGLAGAPKPLPEPNGTTEPTRLGVGATATPFIIGGLLGYAALRWGLPSL